MKSTIGLGPNEREGPNKAAAAEDSDAQPFRTIQMRAAHKGITSCPRRGLSRVESALYLGISPSKFDELRKDGRVRPPRLIDGRKVWDVKELDFAFEEFPLESNEETEDWTAVV